MPDEEMLALWVDDELTGESAATVSAWAATQPEWLTRREEARQIKQLLRAHLPASEEPPYADFFNSRISREIAREAVAAGHPRGSCTPGRPGGPGDRRDGSGACTGPLHPGTRRHRRLLHVPGGTCRGDRAQWRGLAAG